MVLRATDKKQPAKKQVKDAQKKVDEQQTHALLQAESDLHLRDDDIKPMKKK